MTQPAAVLRVLVQANTKGATTGLLRLNTTLAATDAQAGKTRGQMAAMAKTAGKVGVALGAAGLALGVKKAFGEFREAEKATNQTRAVLKSTGNQAKVTAKQIENLANRISLKAGIDDEAIQSGENLLLTFTKIRNEQGKGNKVFNQATQVITDMSVALDQDLKSSAIQVGKALQDPEKGITALKRVGVNFSETQKDMIVGWVEQGKTLKAQKFILKELTTEFGGSAAAQADSADKLKVAWNNMFESIGKVIGPTIERAMGSLATFLNQMQSGEGAGGRFAAKLREIWGELQPIVEWFGKAAVNVAKFADKHHSITKVAGAVAAVAVAFNTFKIGAAIKAVAAFTRAAVATPCHVRDALKGVKGIFTRVFGAAGTAGGTTAAERAASGIMGTFPTKEGKMKTTTRNVMTRVGKAGGVAFTAGVILGMAALSAGIGHELNKAKKNIIDPWVHKNFGKAGDLYTDIRDFIGKNLPDAVPGAPLVREIFGGGPGGDPKGLYEQMQALVQSNLGQMPGGGTFKGGTWKWANKIAGMFGLHTSSSYRTPQHNAAVGGVPGSLHTHGSLRNPGAIDMVGPVAQMNQAAAWARANIPGIQEVLVHDAGSGLHLHLGFFAKGGKVHKSGLQVVGEKGPEIVSMPVGTEVFSHSKSRSMAARMGGFLPGFASGGTVARAAQAAGFTGANLLRAVAEAKGESGWNENAVGDGGNSIGLMQIHLPSHPWARGLNLKNPFVNMRAAMRVFKGAGGSWAPWHANHVPYIAAARAAIASIAGGGSGGGGRNATILGGTGTLAGRTIDRTPYGGIGKGGILDAFMQAAADRLNMAAALAALNDVADDPSTFLDDIEAARVAVGTWEQWLHVAQLNNIPSGITAAAQNLKQARDLYASLTEVAPADAAAAVRAGLLEQLLREANLRTSVSQAQYGVLKTMPFAGSFGGGGVVPGPIGQPYAAVVHGGETYTPPGGGGIQVIINGSITGTPRGKDPVEVVIGDRRFKNAVRNTRMRPSTPAWGGGWGWG